MRVTADDVQRIYGQRFSEKENQARERIWRVLVQSFFQRWIAPGDTVLDLGCGFGEFIRNVRCRRAIGVDLNPKSADCFAGTKVEFHQGSVCDLSFLEADSVDVAFTSNLIEHLPGKAEVDQMIAQAKRVLRPGGTLIFLGPNVRVVPGAYWDFWDHVVPISDRSLAEALSNQGFEVVDQVERFLPYTTKSAIPKAPWLVWMYLRFPPLWRLLGHQFLVRARKP